MVLEGLLFYGFRAFGFQGVRVLGSSGFVVSGFYCVSLRYHGVGVVWLLGLRALAFYDFRVLGFCGLIALGFWDVGVLIKVLGL